MSMLIPKILKSRMRLRKFDILEDPEDDRKVFFITPPEVYPNLFSLRFPKIVAKSRRKQWERTKPGNASFLSFEANVLSEDEMEQVKEWSERFTQYVLIGLNSNIQSNFSEELDFCLALDFNFLDGMPGCRTLYGEAEYQLKYKQSISSLDILSNGLTKALYELLEIFHPNSSVLSIVPSPPDQCSVPRKLAQMVHRITDIPFVDCKLLCDKQGLKGLSLEEKAKEWNRLYSCREGVLLPDDFSGQTVFLIDDLYQSGTTLWSCAANLKRLGAEKVIGLVCVKTFRDTDNQ